MDDIQIKKLTSDDLHLLTALYNYNDIDNMLKSNSEKLSRGDIDIFGLFCNGKLIGEFRANYNTSSKLFSQKGTRAYLYAFRICQSHQGKGFGSFLINNVIAELKNSGYSEFTVGVEDDNTVAKSIYKKLCFDVFLGRIKEEYQGDSYEYNLYLKK